MVFKYLQFFEGLYGTLLILLIVECHIFLVFIRVDSKRKRLKCGEIVEEEDFFVILLLQRNANLCKIFHNVFIAVLFAHLAIKLIIFFVSR